MRSDSPLAKENQGSNPDQFNLPVLIHGRTRITTVSGIQPATGGSFIYNPAMMVALSAEHRTDAKTQGMKPNTLYSIGTNAHLVTQFVELE